MSRPLFYILFLFNAIHGYSQTSEKTFYGGMGFKSSGFGLTYQSKFETSKGPGKQFDLELTTHHHLQETKSFNTEVNYPSPYVYGKLNKVALLRTSYSYVYKITEFADAQRIGLDLIVGGGLTLGFLKPVYINIIYPDGTGYDIVVSEKYNPEKHTDKSKIAGYSDNRIGMNEIDYKAGFNMAAGISFTWGYFANFPKHLEMGVYGDYFYKPLPIMASVKNKSLNSGVYIKCFIGKRMAKN